jgi:hypothetical protein
MNSRRRMSVPKVNEPHLIGWTDGLIGNGARGRN